MKSEIYYQCICSNGHYWEKKTFMFQHSKHLCPECNEKAKWINWVSDKGHIILDMDNDSKYLVPREGGLLC